jgi:hypothetical protein
MIFYLFWLIMVMMNKLIFNISIVSIVGCWFQLHGVRSCDMFTWDDEIEGHPPYVRPTEHVPRNIVNRNSEETSCGANRSNCKCSNVLTQVEKILKEIEVNKHEKMKLKLHNAKKTLKMYRNLLFLSWMVVFAYFKMFC